MVPRVPGRQPRSLSRVLVTGAGGYLGGRLTRTLAGDPDAILRALVRRRVAWLGAEQAEVDLARDPAGLAAACAGMECVVHLAGPNEAAAALDPVRAMTETIAATARVADAAAAAGASRIVYVSTVHVYGDTMTAGIEVTEDSLPRPHAPYAIARLASEHVLRTAAQRGVDVVVLRLTNSVGAPAHPAIARWTLVGNDLCRQGVVDGALRLRSDGTQWRDFVPLADVCDILAAAALGRLAPGTYNLGSGRPMTVMDFAHAVQDAVERAVGRRPTIEAPPAAGRPAAPPRVDVSRLAAAGFTAGAAIDAAIDETVRFCLEAKEVLAG